MPAWSLFYAATTAAAATLMGLLFVAVSVSASAIIPLRQASARALSEQALANLLTTLLLSLVALMPGLSFRTFGVVTLWLVIPPTLLTLWRLGAMTMRSAERGRLVALRRHGASLFAFGMLIFAAVRLSTNRPDHLALLAAGLLLLISSATMSAWELLLTLGRAGGAPAREVDLA